MSLDYGNLCSVILKQYFGEVVQIVGDCLFVANWRTLYNLVKTTNLTKREVCKALAVLCKYHLVSFRASNFNPSVAEYLLNRDEVLYVVRYARYVHRMQMEYGNIGSFICEEILHNGSQTGTNLMLKYLADANEKEKIETVRDIFVRMIRANYLIRLPKLVQGERSETVAVPKLHIDVDDLFNPPNIDLSLLAKIRTGTILLCHAGDSDTLWQINFSRFHQDFRDSIMIGAIERKMGSSAAECFQYILKQMYERTDPWQRVKDNLQQISNPFTVAEIKQMLLKNSKNFDLMTNLEQYITLIADDSLGFIRKIGEMGSGQYVVDLSQAFEELTLCCIENIITERFGSKASRIFRVVRMKKYIEQEDLQKEAMIPAKEAKLLSYNLFQEQFLQIKSIRKPGGGGAAAKAFFLFHLKHLQIVTMLLDICYKALYNDITRSNYEKVEHKRLIDKSQKLDSIVATMEERGESEDYIAEILETLTPPEREILEKVKNRIKILSKAELTIDDNIFLLQMYIHHCSHLPTATSVAK
uniref:DNA-directed RNA polymerase III subunit RPC3 n=1 Tax=Glossina palpalis gambiensis TaxID=67801 RepID=A0A1B0BG50_9MUSC